MLKVSPSDFAYLYQECKHCYYLKAKKNIPPPNGAFPRIFSDINSKIQNTLLHKNLKTLSSDLPDGIVESQEEYITSARVKGTDLYITGRCDLLIKKNDGGYLVVDLKISQAKEDKVDLYKTQLFSYKYAFENPKSGTPKPIDQLALLVFYPESVSFKDSIANIKLPPKFMNIPIDEKAFFTFMKEVDGLLKGPLPPEGDSCNFCNYRKKFFGQQTLI
ncbi:hypothetical protein B6D29_01160 [Microgenomates bacterium UTCPR1]|nr:MAG: hypothetical protein B6D29_01160 [Microgenomates bacterium UTCPR1]